MLDAKGVSQFHLIQPRIANTDPNTIAHLVRSTPVIYFAFDLLYLDGYDLRNVALAKRRELLAAGADAGRRDPHLRRLPRRGRGDCSKPRARTAWKASSPSTRNSCYESRRSREWLKIKIVSEQEFVIGGFTEPQGDRELFRRAGAGRSQGRQAALGGQCRHRLRPEDSWPRIYARLEPLVTKTCPFAERPKPDKGMTWVKPELVCQVKLRQLDAGRPPARPRVPRPARRRGRRRSRPRSASRRAEPARHCRPGRRQGGDAHHRRPHPQVHQPAKLYYPDDGVAKRDVINYYDAVADLILPHLKDRPLSLKRYPNGIKEEFFFQKDTPDTYPDWLRTELIDRRHQLRVRRRPRQPALPGQPGLHRSEPVDEPRRARSTIPTSS